MTSPTTAAALRATFPWAGLVALAVAAFLSISAEMLPTGLLPEMGSDLHVSESSVGLLVSVFAFTVVLTSAILTHLTSRIPRHRLLVGLIVMIALGAAGTAFAPTYGWMIGVRIAGGLAHGVFSAITGAYAAHLVPRAQVGRALAVTSSGGTLAMVMGVPLGTVLGQAVGWRFAFGFLSILMLGGAVLVWRLLPDVGSGASDAAQLRQEAADAAMGATPVGPGALVTGSIPIIRDGTRAAEKLDPSVFGVVVMCVVTGLFMIGHYALYTYIAPFLTTVSGIASNHLGIALFAYGVAGAAGLALVGWILGKRTGLTIPISMGFAGAAVLALLLFEGRPGASLVVFVILGVTFGALAPLLQTRLLEVTPARIRDIASAFYASSFNVGIGFGALVGGFVLTGAGLGALPVLYVIVAAVMIVVVILSNVVLSRRQAARRQAARGHAARG